MAVMASTSSTSPRPTPGLRTSLRSAYDAVGRDADGSTSSASNPAVPIVASSGFRVPLAVDPDGRLVPPERAEARATHRCPQCQGIVALHAGEKKRRHFHHHNTTEGCAAESVSHLTAKQLIVRAVRAWRNGGDAPVFVRRCAHAACTETVRQPMPAKVLHAELEVRLRSGRVVDVALLGPARIVIAAIEVFATHRVDDDKVFDLGAPWIEVDALAVCRDEGRVLTAVRDKLRPWLCAAHGSSRKTAGTAHRERAIRRASALRALSFSPDAFPGYAVGEIVRCDNGHDAIVWKWRGTIPPWPRPPLVVARETAKKRGIDLVYANVDRTVREVLPFRRAWASTCATCGLLVGEVAH